MTVRLNLHFLVVSQLRPSDDVTSLVDTTPFILTFIHTTLLVPTLIHITLLVLTLLLFDLTFFSSMFDCYHSVSQLFTQCYGRTYLLMLLWFEDGYIWTNSL